MISVRGEGWGRISNHLIPAVLLHVLLFAGCSSGSRLASVRDKGLEAGLSLPPEHQLHRPSADSPVMERDTLKVTGPDGREMLIMKAVLDEETGEMVATEQLNAATVTARFRNVAERHGKVNLEFLVTVPRGMQDSRWQLRLSPQMRMADDSVSLDDILITGAAYRKSQLRGYQQYERFLSRIISDTLAFVNRRALEVFLRRNLPAVYAFRTDSTYVSDEEFESAFGVTERQAVNHYTYHIAKYVNEWRISRKGKMWKRLVKAPMLDDGIRLDTVIRNADGDFVYSYIQEISTGPGLRKLDIALSGGIYEYGKRIYDIPEGKPLTFYISSVSTLADQRERYRTVVVPRNAEVDSYCHLDFETGSAALDEGFGNNPFEVSRIKSNLRTLLCDPSFDLDSIIIVASASPEGDYASNSGLSLRRAATVSGRFSAYVGELRDSLRRDAGVMLDFGSGESSLLEVRNVDFIARSGGENWDALDDLVEKDDTLFSDVDKSLYRQIRSMENPDERERLLSQQSFYQQMKSSFYPRLRTVRFNFHLHRKGMIQDTVTTSVLDSVYMSGVRAIAEHDYRKALELLRPYQDYNTAVACVALDMNLSAMEILGKERRTPAVDYLLAILYSRNGEYDSAVEHYLAACAAERSFVHRGNLDPEISQLIENYNLNVGND